MSWDPIRELQAWQERLVSHRHDSWTPPIDVYETSEMYIVTAELPGLTREEIELAVDDSRLTLRGRRPDPATTSGDQVRYHQVERGRGPFMRTFEFAERVDGDAVSADLANGVLTVTLPKRPESPPRKIQVR
jgi:HSP20 family protein